MHTIIKDFEDRLLLERENELEFEITGNAQPEVHATGSPAITGNENLAVKPGEEDRMEIIELDLPVKYEPAAEPEIQEVVDLGSYSMYDSYSMTHRLYLLNTLESI